MRQGEEGLEAAVTRASQAALGDRDDADAHRDLRTWLVLASAALCASARGVACAPSADQVVRAARGEPREILRVLEDGLLALDVEAPPVDRDAASRAARALLGATGTRDDLAPFLDLDEASLGAVRESGMSSAARRARGAHSTPRALADAVAGDGLAALAAAGVAAHEARVLDPAAGGGALLLAVARRLLQAADGAAEGEGERAALRGAIAARLYGVERDAHAAAIARAAIALWGAERGQPTRATAHQIATGDVLLAVDASEVNALIGPSADRGLARDLADALVDSFFATPAAGRARERARRVAAAAAAAAGDAAARARIALWGAAGRARGAVHPSLAWRGLAWRGPRGAGADASPGGVGGEPRFELAVLNPPFLGGKRIATVHGEAYAAWLASREPRASGNADLAAHVLLATRRWLAPRSAVAIVATNALVAGATRHAALERLLEEGHGIASAWRSARWPGVASVNVVRVALVRGAEEPLLPRLDGGPVAGIDAGLRVARQRPPPRSLAENDGVAFVGFFLRGDGFVVGPDEARTLLARDPRNATCLRPYLVGEDVLRDPMQRPARFVVDFGTRSLEEARQFPDLLALVEERVRPVREALAPTGSNRTHQRTWWRFANPRPALRRALAGRARCLVAPRVSKHLTFTAVATDIVFSEQLVVIACDAPGRLGVLASWVHDAWARAHSSSLQSGLRYLPSRAFATFPFPSAEATAPEVDALAVELEQARHAATRAHRIGLTALRDRVDASGESDARVLAVRRAQEALDRAVLGAFGWGDLLAPPSGSRRDLRDVCEARLLERLADENERRAGHGDGRVTLV